MAIKLKYTVLLCILCAALSVFVYERAFNSTNTIISTDTIYVDRFVSGHVVQVTPAPIKIVQGRVRERVTVHDTIAGDVDTAVILADYYSRKYYDDYLVRNDTAVIRLQEEVYAGAIENRFLDYSFKCTDRTVTNTVYRSGFYYTGAIQGFSGAFGASAGVAYQNKHGFVIGANMGYFVKPYISIQFSHPF